jgi:hypothetical protein
MDRVTIWKDEIGELDDVLNQTRMTAKAISTVQGMKAGPNLAITGKENGLWVARPIPAYPPSSPSPLDVGHNTGIVYTISDDRRIFNLISPVDLIQALPLDIADWSSIGGDEEVVNYLGRGPTYGYAYSNISPTILPDPPDNKMYTQITTIYGWVSVSDSDAVDTPFYDPTNPNTPLILSTSKSRLASVILNLAVGPLLLVDYPPIFPSPLLPQPYTPLPQSPSGGPVVPLLNLVAYKWPAAHPYLGLTTAFWGTESPILHDDAALACTYRRFKSDQINASLTSNPGVVELLTRLDVCKNQCLVYDLSILVYIHAPLPGDASQSYWCRVDLHDDMGNILGLFDLLMTKLPDEGDLTTGQVNLHGMVHRPMHGTPGGDRLGRVPTLVLNLTQDYHNPLPATTVELSGTFNALVVDAGIDNRLI